MSPANRAPALGNGFLGCEETTVVSMRAQNSMIDPISSLSAVKQAAP